MRLAIFLIFVSIVLALMHSASPEAAQTGAVHQRADGMQGPIVSERVLPSLRTLRDLDASREESSPYQPIPRQNPLQFEPDQGRRDTWGRANVPIDPLIQPVTTGPERTPAVSFTFEGIGTPTACASCVPPDPNGDVGLNHYIQMVNATKVGIYNKSGVLLIPIFNLSALWTSGVCTSNAGDPVVLYDSLANRWLLSQFAPKPNTHVCIAISQTDDPLGAYYAYTFNVGAFPDYFKLGVWPDAYYMSANEGTSSANYTAYAFDRSKMLAGAAAGFQKFTGGTNLFMPSDLDGPTPPPAGAPAIFYTFKDNSFHGGADRLEVREFHVDWNTPANTTFNLAASLNIAPFTYTVCGFFSVDCVRQSGTTQRIDVVSEWPMFRFPYRNLGTHQALVGTFTVGGGLGETGSAIRWFELRKTAATWTLYQEGTFDPGDGHDRFMGSIAMDAAGNIALGYSVSSSAINPAIRYATRLATDALGTLQTEAVLINGAGSQTGSPRWGDYSALQIDPSNDFSFWYTNEYYPVSSPGQWKTRVGVFSLLLKRRRGQLVSQ